MKLKNPRKIKTLVTNYFKRFKNHERRRKDLTYFTVKVILSLLSSTSPS